MATSKCWSSLAACDCLCCTTMPIANSTTPQARRRHWCRRTRTTGSSSACAMTGQPSSVTNELVWIPPQTAVLGSDHHYAEEGPARPVSVDGFWIQTHQVTNTDFAEFVS